MKALTSCLYEGSVVHKRLVPRRHAFSYRVFALCLDVDEIDVLDRRLRLFSRNKRNLLGFRDSDLGARGPEPVATKVRRLLDECGLTSCGAHIEVVCYPRLLGYVFNPLSVYFCRESSGAIGAVVYEVSNTFGERKSYVIPAGEQAPAIPQTCAKEMYVSPFTSASGTYGFHYIAPSDRIVIGVNFREDGQPVLKTHFRGERRPLTDATIAAAVARHPLMTLKVMSAIHFEALRLWVKGVPLVPRHSSPSYSFTIVDRPQRTQTHA
ncbi:MAG: DUF1365 domain-containing protein [Hyphomicrobiaceae bacterium]